VGAGSAKESLGDEGSLPDSLEKRIEQLQSFIARVEDLVKGAGSAKESLGDEGSLPDSLEKRIEQLQSFIARVEDLVKS
jgi:uncharacterized small protein (DUF1192 family)